MLFLLFVWCWLMNQKQPELRKRAKKTKDQRGLTNTQFVVPFTQRMKRTFFLACSSEDPFPDAAAEPSQKKSPRLDECEAGADLLSALPHLPAQQVLRFLMPRRKDRIRSDDDLINEAERAPDEFFDTHCWGARRQLDAKRRVSSDVLALRLVCRAVRATVEGILPLPMAIDRVNRWLAEEDILPLPAQRKKKEKARKTRKWAATKGRWLPSLAGPVASCSSCGSNGMRRVSRTRSIHRSCGCCIIRIMEDTLTRDLWGRGPFRHRGIISGSPRRSRRDLVGRRRGQWDRLFKCGDHQLRHHAPHHLPHVVPRLRFGDRLEEGTQMGLPPRPPSLGGFV